MSLKKSLFLLTLASLLTAALLTVLLFWVYMEFHVTSAPDGVMLYVNKGYVIEPADITGASGQARLMNLLALLQIVLPVLFFVGALFLAVFLFYRWKLKEPLTILSDATTRIMQNDLDFSVASASSDELGALCGAFETMRGALLANNQKLWRQTEEQKRLNAAFSHDLRNPLTVLKGSAKMAKRCAGDNGPLLSHLDRIEAYTKRLEQYVEIMSTAGRLEQVPLEPAPFSPLQLSGELESAMRLLAADSGKSFSFHCTRVPSGGTESARALCVDKNALLQIAENLVANALRFAKQRVSVSLSLTEDTLVLEVADDGGGFPDRILKNGIRPFQKGTEDASHFGMGLYICRLLCEKHGGSIEVKNLPPGGACVRATLHVENPRR